MYTTILFVLLVIVQNSYSEEYPTTNIDLDEVLQNERLMKNYLDCALGVGKCTPEGEELKKAIPDALQNECAKCNDQHKAGIKKVITHLIKNKPEWWKQLKDKFDPNGEFAKKYEELLKKEGLLA